MADDRFGFASPLILSELRLPRSGAPLDSCTRELMEARFGHDLTRVRVHTDDWAARAAEALNARAFTLGHHIVFGAGEYPPETPEGMRLLAHELTHVIQQRHGTHTHPVRLVIGSAMGPLEREAELAAIQVMRGGPLPPITADLSGTVRRAARIVPGSAHITVSDRPTAFPPAVPDPGTLGHLTRRQQFPRNSETPQSRRLCN